MCPNPKAQVMPFDQGDKVSISLRSGVKTFETESATANKFLQGLATCSPPAAVFCSRELEGKLSEFVTAKVASASLGLSAEPFPSDDSLRAEARDILGMQTTAADDPVLLTKFKTMMQEKLGLSRTGAQQQRSQATAVPPSTSATEEAQQLAAMPLDIDMNITDGELTDILQDMDFDFGDQVSFG